MSPAGQGIVLFHPFPAVVEGLSSAIGSALGIPCTAVASDHGVLGYPLAECLVLPFRTGAWSDAVATERPCVALVESDTPGEFQVAFATGASGVARLDAPIQNVVAVVAGALDGLAPVPISVLRRMATSSAVALPDGVFLSEFEMRLLEGLARGLTIEALAERESYSARTVQRSIRRAFVALGAANRAEAMIRATKYGLLTG